MTKQTIGRLVHHYDTEHHRIRCESPGADDHSTKHERSVTCGDCIALLREGDEQDRASASATASSGTSV